MKTLIVVALAAGALMPHSQHQPCSMAPASSAANARIRVTCVKVSRAAARTSASSWRVVVHSDACKLVSGSTYDCTAQVRLGRDSCVGTERVTGRSRHPRLLRARFRGFGCVR